MDLAPPKPRLLLVDGMGVVRRVWEAVKGEDTAERAAGAMQSSWGSFLRGLREHEPTHFLAAFDHGGETWRHRLYPEYKADRTPMSAHLAAALPEFIKRISDAGMKAVRIPDVEADDVLASLGVRAVRRGFDVTILSSDKDLLALLPLGVKIYDHFHSEWRDDDYVMARFGVQSHQMTDLLALMGDAVDGIPGVHGIGPKTAARLLSEYQNLDAILCAAPSIPGKTWERLATQGDIATLSHQLASMRFDLELGLSPRDLQIPAPLADHIAEMPSPRFVRTSPMVHRVEAPTDVLRPALAITPPPRPLPSPTPRPRP